MCRIMPLICFIGPISHKKSTPSSIIARQASSNSFGDVSPLIIPSAMSVGGVPGSHLSPVCEEYTVISGERSFSVLSISVKCFFKSASTGCINSVWYPALQPFNSETFCAPRSFAKALAESIAPAVPDKAKPEGNKRLPSLQIPLFSSTASSQIVSSSSSLKPTTDSIFCGSVASSTVRCMSSPRIFANRTPSSKLKQPAAQSAANSPLEIPAAAAASLFSLPSWSLNHSKPHMLATNTAGWHTSIRSNFDSGPISVTSKRS
mmetsp:Transcript_61110/g.97005  ORF Transcript_61110/g.97005 Transcript_61110/m.97005 type:complete len:262 (-) Transcript_61110:700-1485(-)